MPLIPWRAVSRTVRFKNPWWSYGLDTVVLPNGKEGEYHYVHSLGSACVIPVLDEGSILLVNQYRYLGNKESLEFPCGAVKDGSSHDQTAWHELAEETGYSAVTLVQIGAFNPYNGVTDEICNVYVARELRHIGAAPDETEQFELVRLPVQEVDRRIREGLIWDGMSIAAWHLARARGLL